MTRGLLIGLHLAAAAARRLPRRRVGEPLCQLFGSLWYLAAPTSRAAVRDNLRHVLGRDPAPALVRAVFVHGAFNYWDTFAVPHLDRQRLLDLIDLHGLEHLRAAHALGRGVIVASAHLGSVGLVGQVVPALGYPLLGVLEPIQPPEVYAFFSRQRAAFGARLVPLGAAATRELLAALRRNAVVGLITDRDVTGTAPVIDFFGAPARFPDGAATLAVRTGAPIVIGVAVRRADGRFDATFEPALLPPASGDRRADVRALTRWVARRLEYHVASHPEQWTVFQRRWPGVDEGDADNAGDASDADAPGERSRQ